MAREKDKTYSDEEVRAKLAERLPQWRLEDGHICRRYKTSGWRSSLMVANAIGHLAEVAWHHPDLLVTFPAVEVRLQNHDAGGITDKDFALAERIEATVLWQPGAEDGPFEGIPAGSARFAYVTDD